jgi:hypothetical protein
MNNQFTQEKKQTKTFLTYFVIMCPNMKTILCLAMILFAHIGVSAQEKSITQPEFDAVYKTSFEKWKGKTYRMAFTAQSTVEGKPEAGHLSKSINEFASSTVSRSVMESTLNSKTSRIEAIRIDDKTYRRTGDGKWQEGVYQPYSPKPENKPDGATNQEDGQIEYKYLGTEKLNNQTANVYSVIKKFKGVNSSTKKEYISTTATKYWFAEDGSILRLNMEMKSRDGIANLSFTHTSTWELDPNIKIQAPNLN